MYWLHSLNPQLSSEHPLTAPSAIAPSQTNVALLNSTVVPCRVAIAAILPLYWYGHWLVSIIL